MKIGLFAEFWGLWINVIILIVIRSFYWDVVLNVIVNMYKVIREKK